jgi:hypothetical protein
MDETRRAGRTAEQPVEGRAAAPRARRAAPRALPGLLAALLCLWLAAGGALAGRVALPVAAALALGLAASIAAQPGARAWLRSAAARPGLRHAALVAGVAALGAGLRFWGIHFGLPYFEHPDEWAVADRALRMLRAGDPSPHAFIYPTLYTYMQVGVAAAHFLWGAGAGLYTTLADIDPARYYLWARALTAALGTGAVLLTYLLGRRLYGPAAGLLAAAALAVYPAAVGDAHYVTTDTPSMFFTVAALLVITGLAFGAGRPHRRAFGAGFAAGLAISTKYNVVVLALPLALAVIMAHGWTRRALAGLGLAGAGVVAGFTLGTPMWLPELPTLLNDIASIIVHYRYKGHPGAESSFPALFYWEGLAANGALLAWAFAGGVLLAFLRGRRADALLLAFAVPYFLQLTGVKVVFFRNTMPLLPVLCVLAGASLVWFVARVRGSEGGEPERQSSTPTPFAGRTRERARFIAPPASFMMAILGVLLLAQPLAQSVRDDWLRARPTTRILATAWVAQQAADGDRIWLEDQTLILPARLRGEGGKPITGRDPAWYREQGYRFLVANLDTKHDPAALARFGEPAARFSRGERLGPNLAIYATGLGDPAGEPRTPSGATLGGGAVTLDGYRHPAEARPGATLPLALYWRANRPLPADYTVFVHLLDATGGKAAQRDLPPLEGRRPTSGWRPGELLRDDQDLPLPPNLPPGTYRLVVGMYDPATLAAITDGGPIDIGTVEVRGR